MLLILSQEFDVTAMKVTQWLKHYKIPFLNIEDSKSLDILDLISINNNEIDIQFTYQKNKYSFDDFSFVWNRRGRFTFSRPKTDNIQENLGIKNNSFYNHIANEGETLKDYIAYKLSQKFHIDDSRFYSVNKLVVLDIANQIGLKTPNTYITNDYMHIKHKTDKLITKDIQGVIHFTGYDGNHLHQQTQIVDEKSIENENSF